MRQLLLFSCGDSLPFTQSDTETVQKHFRDRNAWTYVYNNGSVSLGSYKLVIISLAFTWPTARFILEGLGSVHLQLIIITRQVSASILYSLRIVLYVVPDSFWKY
ncbi:unnamed protein product [Urochloa humidicola]